MKRLVYNILYARWLYMLGFGSILPVIAAYQGVLLGVTVIGIITIVKQLVVELLPLLKRYKYKNLYLAEVTYTSGYVLVLASLIMAGYSLETVAAIGCIGLIPYGLLRAIDNKFNTLILECYSPRILESIRIKEAIIESRASIIAMAVTSVIAYYDQKSVLPVIISMSILTVANVWSWYTYVSVIRKLKR